VVARVATRPASDIVATALASSPDTTTAELAVATGLGKSTVSKALAALETAGSARRQAGGRSGARRLPDRWSVAAKARRSSRPTSTGKVETTSAGNGRLGKGELGAMVLDYLATHPGEEIGLTGIGRALGRSQGAVSNALSRLVEAGHAQLTGKAPRRYRYAAE
jgi:DNA-binding IclR family transcriptional regulator